MQSSLEAHMGAAKGSLDYSKSEKTVENIVIQGSQFMAKWVKDEGYAIGYENIKITKSYKTLEEALNQIGYGVELDDEGDETLVKVGGTDFETILRIVKAVIIVTEENNKIEKNGQENN